MFYNNRRPSNVRITLTEHAEAMINRRRDMPNTTNLLSVEPWHEDALSNIKQGTTETTARKRLQREDKAKMNLLEDMEDFVGDDITLGHRLAQIRDVILNGSFLVRKLSEAESANYVMSFIACDPENTFQKGKECMKAFRIDEVYSFKDKKRNEDLQSYDHFLKIPLTPKLKQYFVEFLFANMNNLLGAQFNWNPQFKFENNGVTILIPKTGWRQFWSFVGNNYSLE